MIYHSIFESAYLEEAQNKLNNSWLKSLFDLFNGYDITIAGGAIRDIIFNKPVADIDVFYVDEIPDHIVNELVLEEKGYPYEGTNFLVTHEGEYQGTKVQFIKVDKEYSHVIIKTFPCSISQVFVKHKTLWSSEEFLLSFNNIVKWKPNSEFKYHTKIVSKYPEMIHLWEESNLPTTANLFTELAKPLKLLPKKKYRILNSTTECYREFSV